MEAHSIHSFKGRLDKYWTNQYVIYNDCDLTGGIPVCI